MKTETNINSYISLPCKKCNRIVDNVGDSAKSVICSMCTLMGVGFPEEPKSAYKPTGRPAGWHWMVEFVDKDGNVFHKGVEQTKLKGSRPITKIEPKQSKRKLSKGEKANLKQSILQQMAMVRGQVKKARFKKDIKSGQSQLKRLERQLKKIR